MSLLTICENVAAEVGIAQPASIVNSLDPNAIKLLRLANQSGRELARYHDWQSLTTSFTFTSVATQVQTDLLPTDFGRFVYNADIWDRTSNQRLVGPTPHRIWSQLLNGVTGGVAGWWRLIAGQLNILPVMAAGHTVAFDYVSRNWAASSGGTAQATFQADTDVCRIIANTGETIGEDLIELEMTWRWRKTLGLPQYAEDMATCEREKEKAAGRDRGTGRMRPASTNFDYPPAPFWDGTVG